ncbi:S-layer homology domain-containing protein [Paenibacillus glycinis]|uniref:SLH domain-containing protein n=1 Tax=Paenibacillus glycinis TaxID=2697035 RepID=A0ABW9XPG5_9BACL|nr:S-layer homology domain-containing protein [Paenibacillus glycinis]NBD24523.1 hypothetical protein [Paenibacillus glycinis]
MSRKFTGLKTLSLMSLALGCLGGSLAAPLQAGAEAGGGSGATTIMRAHEAIAVDGVVDVRGEWGDANAIALNGITDGNGNAHGAEIYFRYDADNLYIGAIVQDPTPMINEKSGSGIWDGDNLELFIGTEDVDLSEFPDKANTMLASDVQLVLSGSVSNGPQSYLYRGSEFTFPAFQLAAKRAADKKSYTLEASVPLGELGITEPWDHKQIRLNAVLNDGGSSGRGQWGWTTTGESVKKNRGLWGLANLEAGAAPESNITAQVSVSDSNQITVSGRTTGAAGKDMTLLVADPNGMTAYVGQAKSDAGGNYAFVFPITKGSGYADGTYTATVGGDGVTLPASATFSFAPGEPSPVTPPYTGGPPVTPPATTGTDEGADQPGTGGDDQPDNGPAPILSDISGHWAEAAIKRAVELGIVNGYEDRTFLPNRPVTRAEFAVMLSRTLKPEAGGKLEFKDAASIPAWAADAVGSAVAAGWISGYEDGTFRADRRITRAELATMAVRAMGWEPDAALALAFADAADIPAWASPYVALAAERKLVNGRGDDSFVPNGIATRAEAAELLMRMLDAKTTEGG